MSDVKLDALAPSPPKMPRRISLLTGKPPIKRGTIFQPSQDEVKKQMEADAYSGKSSYISDLQIEELKKVVSAAAAKSAKVQEEKLLAEKELEELEAHLNIMREKYKPICDELDEKKLQMKQLKEALAHAKETVKMIQIDQVSIVRDAINGHDRRIKKNRRAVAAAAKVATGSTTSRKGGASVVTLTTLTPRLVGSSGADGSGGDRNSTAATANNINTNGSSSQNNGVDKLVNITKENKDKKKGV